MRVRYRGYGNAPGASGVTYPMNKSGGCNPGDQLIGSTCYEMKMFPQLIGPPPRTCRDGTVVSGLNGRCPEDGGNPLVSKSPPGQWDWLFDLVLLPVVVAGTGGLLYGWLRRKR